MLAADQLEQLQVVLDAESGIVGVRIEAKAGAPGADETDGLALRGLADAVAEISRLRVACSS